jgi:hypothetical protein
MYRYLDHAFLTLLHYKLAKEKSLFEHQASPRPDSPDSGPMNPYYLTFFWLHCMQFGTKSRVYGKAFVGI